MSTVVSHYVENYKSRQLAASGWKALKVLMKASDENPEMLAKAMSKLKTEKEVLIALKAIAVKMKSEDKEKLKMLMSGQSTSSSNEESGAVRISGKESEELKSIIQENIDERGEDLPLPPDPD